MILDSLKDFQWLNDPVDVFFNEKGMNVLAREKTDFWQSAHHNFAKDNGHFFYAYRMGDFSMTLKWSFVTLNQFQQCGIMVRIDEKNWIKASLMYDDAAYPKLGSAVTQRGYSDWAPQNMPLPLNEIWYRISKKDGDYVVSYSLDGKNFIQIRLAALLADQPEVKVGAYICSPKVSGFEATLELIV